MKLFFYRILCVLLLLLTLAACGSHLMPVGKVGELSRDDFMAALRWKQFPVAASMMQPEYRQDFLATFVPLKDINITDVRLVDLRMTEQGRRFETTMEMDYYLLPSVTLKTFSFDQTWTYFEGDKQTSQGFLITTPFPAFP